MFDNTLGNYDTNGHSKSFFLIIKILLDVIRIGARQKSRLVPGIFGKGHFWLSFRLPAQIAPKFYPCFIPGAECGQQESDRRHNFFGASVVSCRAGK